MKCRDVYSDILRCAIVRLELISWKYGIKFVILQLKPISEQ